MRSGRSQQAAWFKLLGASAIDWEQVEAWDRAYYLHNIQAEEEHVWRCVAYQEGHYIYMTDGKRLLDFQSQLISASMGHRHPHVVAGAHEALERYGQVAFFFANDYKARAAKLIVADILGEDGWAGRLRILPSGTDAVLSALAMARLFTGRKLILTQQHSFHGMTPEVGTWVRGYRSQLASPSDEQWVLDVPEFPPPGIVPIPPPDPQDFDASNGLPSIEETERIIDEIGGNQIAAVITETMLATGGIMSHDEYLPRLRKLTEKHGILWIDDEVICGFGRLGKWFSYQYYDGLVPDIMTIGKGMNSCILPVAGVVANREISDFFERNRWYSGSTWDGHPIISASIVFNIEAMISDGAIENATKVGLYLEQGLQELRGRHRSVGRIGGRGVQYAVDLVGEDGLPLVHEDRDFAFSGDLSKLPTRLIGEIAGEHGVYLGGILPNTIKVAPPLTVTTEEIDKALEALDAGLHELERRFF